LQNVNLVVRLSYHEVFPVAYLEAITCGIPVVATPVGDTEYLAEKTGAIKIIPLGDPRATADVIQEMVDSNGLSRDVISKCNDYLDEISWKTQAEKTRLLFEDVLRNNQND